MTPHERLAGSVDASRPCPGTDRLRDAFRITGKRTVRRSDGTVSVEGIRYQIPAPWRHLREAWVRYARWDLASVDLVDGPKGERLCTLYPLDRRAQCRRRTPPRSTPAATMAAALAPAPAKRRCSGASSTIRP